MNLRVLKKDIEFLTNDFISDCVLFSDLHPESNEEEVRKLIVEAVEMANDLFDRANHPENKKDAKAVKAHYKAICSDCQSSLDALYEKLSGLVKNK